MRLTILKIDNISEDQSLISKEIKCESYRRLYFTHLFKKMSILNCSIPYQLFFCVNSAISLPNHLRTDNRHLQSFSSVVAWQASEQVYRSNLISLGLTNNSCQNVTASCGRGRSWICHAGMQVKQLPGTTSPSNTGLRTLISFMTVSNLAFF